MNVQPGRNEWFRAFTTPFEPAPPPASFPTSAVGRKVADMLAKLRQERKGSPMRQVSPPRKSRTRRRGELTITEFAEEVGIGPRRVRLTLLRMGILQTEIEVREQRNGLPDYQRAARLSPKAVECRFGRRIEPKDGRAYDVLTPKGQDYLTDRLRGEVERKVSPRHAVRETIRKHLQRGMTQAEIVRLTGLSRQLVSHHVRGLAA